MEQATSVSPLLEYVMWALWILVGIAVMAGMGAAVQDFRRAKRVAEAPAPAEPPSPPAVETPSLALPLLAERHATKRTTPARAPPEETTTRSSA